MPRKKPPTPPTPPPRANTSPTPPTPHPPAAPSAPAPSQHTFQQDLDRAAPGDVFQLSRVAYGGEIAGPITLRKDIVLDGSGATLWAGKGPVLSIATGKATLRHLRIEVTGDPHHLHGLDAAAIAVAPGANVTFAHVEVRGEVRGIGGEEGRWSYPPSLQLGRFDCRRDTSHTLHIVTPVGCRVESHIEGLEVSPHQLPPGHATLTLTLPAHAVRPDTLIHGIVTLKTAHLSRPIRITAHAVESASITPADALPHLIWQSPLWSQQAASHPQSAPPTPAAPHAQSTPAAPALDVTTVTAPPPPSPVPPQMPMRPAPIAPPPIPIAPPPRTPQSCTPHSSSSSRMVKTGGGLGAAFNSVPAVDTAALANTAAPQNAPIGKAFTMPSPTPAPPPTASITPPPNAQHAPQSELDKDRQPASKKPILSELFAPTKPSEPTR